MGGLAGNPGTSTGAYPCSGSTASALPSSFWTCAQWAGWSHFLWIFVIMYARPSTSHTGGHRQRRSQGCTLPCDLCRSPSPHLTTPTLRYLLHHLGHAVLPDLCGLNERAQCPRCPRVLARLAPETPTWQNALHTEVGENQALRYRAKCEVRAPTLFTRKPMLQIHLR